MGAALVDQDPKQPRAETMLLAVPAEGAEGEEKRVLKHVVRIVRVSRHPAGVASTRGMVPVHEGRVGHEVTRPHEGDQLGIGQVRGQAWSRSPFPDRVLCPRAGSRRAGPEHYNAEPSSGVTFADPPRRRIGRPPAARPRIAIAPATRRASASPSRPRRRLGRSRRRRARMNRRRWCRPR